MIKTDVLMSEGNPGGYTLEGLLDILDKEITLKTNNVVFDDESINNIIKTNNGMVQHLLRQAKQIQETTINEIASFKDREAKKVKPTVSEQIVDTSPEVKPKKKTKTKIKKGS